MMGLFFVPQWSFNLLNRVIIFSLTISLLFNYNIKARYIYITISKSDTKNSYFNLFMNTFFKGFLCSGILFLRNGAASYEMESLSLCLTLSFKYCFNMIAKINTNKNYLDYFKNILLSFFFFFSCSKKSRDYVHYEMEFQFTKWSYIIFSSFHLVYWFIISISISRRK